MDISMRSSNPLEMSSRHLGDSPSTASKNALRRHSSMFNSSFVRIATAEDEASRLAALEEVSKPSNGRSAPKNVHDEVITVPRAPRPELVAEKPLLGSEGIVASPDGVLYIVPAAPRASSSSSAPSSSSSSLVPLCEVYSCRTEHQQQASSSGASLMYVSEHGDEHKQQQQDARSQQPLSHAPLFLPLVGGSNRAVGALLDDDSGALRLVVEPGEAAPAQQSRADFEPQLHNTGCPPASSKSVSSAASPPRAEQLWTSHQNDALFQKAVAEGQRLFVGVPLEPGSAPPSVLLSATSPLEAALRAVEGASIHTRPSSNSLVIFGGFALEASGQSFRYRRSLVTVHLPEGSDARYRMRETPTGGVAYPPGVAFHSACITDDNKMIVFGGILEAALPRNTTLQSAGVTPAWRFCGRVCALAAVDDSLPRSSLLLKPSTFSDTPLSRSSQSPSGASGDVQPASDPTHPEELALERNKPLQLLCGNGTYSYDFTTRNWSQMRCVGDVPCGRSHHTSALCGSWMFIAGGMTTGAKSCKDMYALHVPTGVWAAISAEAIPAFPISLMVASPEKLLLFTASRGVYGLGMQELVAHVSAKRRVAVQRIEIAARSATSPSDDMMSAKRVQLSRKELDLQIARLTYERTLPRHLLDPRVQAVREQQEKAYLSFGVACPLRTIKLPPSAVDAATERLHDKEWRSRQEAKRLAALQKYDLNAKKGGEQRKKYMLDQIVDDLYERPRRLYSSRQEERVERALQLQVDQRKRSGLEQDAPAVVTDRLYADVSQRSERLQKLTEQQIAHCRTASPSSPPDAETFLRLYKNEASVALKRELYEELVLKK